MTDLITLAEYKSYQGLTKTDEDTKITFLITAASNLIKTYLGTLFPPESPFTETLLVDYPTDTLYPTYYPVTNLLSVTETDRYNDSTVHIPVSPTDYILNSDGSITRIGGTSPWLTWPMAPGSTTITYEGGYTEVTDVPNDLKLACIELVNYYKNKEFVPSRSLQGATIINAGTSVAELPAHVRAILDYYKV